ALVWSKFPKLTNRQVVARILATVTDDVDIPGRDTATGYGIVRPHVAIRADVALSAPNPIFDELEAATGSSSPSMRSTPSTSGHTTPAFVPQSQKSSGGPSIGAVVGIVAGAAIVLALVVLTIFRSRRAHAGPFV